MITDNELHYTFLIAKKMNPPNYKYNSMQTCERLNQNMYTYHILSANIIYLIFKWTTH